MPTLTLRNTRASVHPWRLGVLHADGRWQALEHFTFPRKRDAVPVLAALQALGVDWAVPPAQWPAAVYDAVCALQEATPGWAVHQRGLAAWEETPHA